LKEPSEQVKAKGEIEKNPKPEIGEHVKLGITPEVKPQSGEVQ